MKIKKAGQKLSSHGNTPKHHSSSQTMSSSPNQMSGKGNSDVVSRKPLGKGKKTPRATPRNSPSPLADKYRGKGIGKGKGMSALARKTGSPPGNFAGQGFLISQGLDSSETRARKKRRFRPGTVALKEI